MGQQIYSGKDIQQQIDKIVTEILKDYGDLEGVVVVGIRTGGADLAQRMQQQFQQKTGRAVPLGILDINLYRDDFDLGDRQPEVRETLIDFDMQGKIVLLVDDVLFTGRTIRAALEAINDYGRPAAVRLAVLIDRGHRELPIAADYVGAEVETSSNEHIVVTFNKDDASKDTIERVELPKA